MGERLRLGVAGCGRVFEQFHFPALKASVDWKLSAVCDINAHRLEWVTLAQPDVATHRSINNMMDQAEIDAVLIATPPTTHTMLSAQVIDRGLHVLLEKPGGHSLADATKLEGIASRFSGVIWVGFNRRFNPNYHVMQETLEGTQPSENAIIRFDLSFSVDDWDSFSGYLGDQRQGGGVAHDVASHQLDLLAWVFSSPVAAVRVQTWDHNDAGAERLTYEVRLGSGVLIHCQAEHGQRYRESLAFDNGSTTLMSFPTGVLSTKRAGLPMLKRWSRIRYWIDRKLIREGMGIDPLRRAYSSQLREFAAAIRGERIAIEGSRMHEVVATHQAIEALIDSWNSRGQWRTVVLEKVPD